MPTYTFACDTCEVSWDIKCTMKEHEILKNHVHCEKCGSKARQTVQPLNFRLQGEGWFGNNADAVASPYGLTQRELDKNLDVEKKVEDVANNFNDKETP